MKRVVLFFLFSISISAQIKGVVLDVNQQPISYVSVWVENENIGTTTDVDGSFEINCSSNKNLIFSILGFQKQTIKASNCEKVTLQFSDIEIDEVVIGEKRFETKQIEIGKHQDAIYQAFDNGPRIDVKFFPYNSKYKKTKFIQKATIFTDSKIENTTIKLHFYEVDTNGFPGKPLLKKDYLVKLQKGVIKHKIDLTEHQLKMPINGLFVGYEKLIIESNKFEKASINQNTNSLTVKTIYYPYVLYNYVKRDFLFTFSGGSWNKKETTTNTKVYEPAINLILTN